MKKVLFLIIAVLSSFSMFAQEKMVITRYDNEEIKINVWDIRNIQFVIDTVTTSYSEPDSIDLGLSVRWGSFNLGASTAEESGKLFGWGSLYDFMHTTMVEFYPCKEPPTSIVCSSYDVANVELGGLWRMPTTEEIQELIDSCEWEWNEEPSGWYVRRNGAEIFMPITYKRSGDNIDSKSVGYYWSGDLAEDISKANALFFSDNDSCTIVQDFRYMGFAIRPVYGEYIPETSLSIKDNDKTTNTSISVNIEIEGGMDNIEECGIIYGTTSELDINSSGKKTLDISTLKKENSIELKGLDFLTTYYIKAYALVDGEYIYTDVITITTEPNYPVPEYVDLGLSVKWATWNMGASSVEDYGGYYRWNDPYCTPDELYNIHDFQYIELTDIAATDYDMAHIQWKKEWRMPSIDEWKELQNKCKWKYIKDYEGTGVTGQLVTGPNGNSIFLPYSGKKDKNSDYKKDQTGYYWTSNSDYINESAQPYLFAFETNNFATLHVPVSDKVPLRAVYGPKAEKPEEPEEPETSEVYEVVDLGLSKLWSTRNLGAKSVEDYGKFFFWGDKDTTRTDFSFSTNYEEIGNNLNETEYDVVHNLLGEGWYIPTPKDFDELIYQCDWEWTSINGVYGFRVSSRENNNSIFLPSSGQIYDNEHKETNDCGYYWSSYIDTDHNYAYCMMFQGISEINPEVYTEVYMTPKTYIYRNIGLNIRPVKRK